MKAAIFRAPGEPLSLEEVPDPQPGPGEVLVKVAACGVCHTDLHYIDHGVPTFKKPPMILGHEASGTVAALGEGVDRFKEGDRVVVPAVFGCGDCHFCRTGRENICQSMVMLGNNVDGAYAELVAVPARELCPLPEEMPLVESSIIADAISTPYHAVRNRAQVGPGDWVAVFGCGGVGINVVQMAVACGGSVVAVDIQPAKLEWAKKLGAAATVNPAEVEDVGKAIRRLTGGGVDVAIEAIGRGETIEAAFSTLRKGGRLVILGYTTDKVSLSAARIMYLEMEVIGTLGCRGTDYPRIVEMARAGRIKVKELVTHQFPLEKINDALDLLRRGDPEALRSVVIP